MSIRLYIGNLPQTFDEQELGALLKSVGEGIRFKAVLDRETGSCRGFGFANIDDEKLADATIEALNGKEFGGSTLRVERSERRDNASGGNRRGGAPGNGQSKVVVKPSTRWCTATPQSKQQTPAGPVSCPSSRTCWPIRRRLFELRGCLNRDHFTKTPWA